MFSGMNQREIESPPLFGAAVSSKDPLRDWISVSVLVGLGATTGTPPPVGSWCFRWWE
jgi:hypothetical protein